MKYLIVSLSFMLVIGCGGAKHSDLFDPVMPNVEDASDASNDVFVDDASVIDVGADSVSVDAMDGEVADAGSCICNLNSSPPEMCNKECSIGYGCFASEGVATENTYQSWYVTCDPVDPANGNVYANGVNICEPNEAGLIRGCLVGSKPGQSELCQIEVMDDAGALFFKNGRCVK